MANTSEGLLNQLNSALSGNATEGQLSGAKDIMNILNSGGKPGTIFGMTVAGLFLSFAFSVLGLVYLRRARKEGRFIIGLCGVSLLVYPIFVSDTWGILGIGLVLGGLPFLLRRVGVDF